MTISQKQLEANRNNAKFGGVKTAEGKEKVRYNAMKHGLLAKHVVIDGDDKAEYLALCSGLYSELSPKNELEKIMVERIITNTWRLRRCLQIEMSLMSYQRDDDFATLDVSGKECQRERRQQFSMLESPIIEKILRYETMMEKGLFKALNELQRIRAQK